VGFFIPIPSHSHVSIPILNTDIIHLHLHSHRIPESDSHSFPRKFAHCTICIFIGVILTVIILALFNYYCGYRNNINLCNSGLYQVCALKIRTTTGSDSQHLIYVNFVSNL